VSAQSKFGTPRELQVHVQFVNQGPSQSVGLHSQWVPLGSTTICGVSTNPKIRRIFSGSLHLDSVSETLT